MTTTTNGQCGRTCSDCEHGYVGPDGLFCMTYREMIDDERVALECVAFDPIPSNIITDHGPKPELEPAVRPKLREQVDEVVAAAPAPELVAACDAYLRLRHCTLFGQVFEIISPRGRAEAAEWLATQITAINFVAPVPL